MFACSVSFHRYCTLISAYRESKLFLFLSHIRNKYILIIYKICGSKCGDSLFYGLRNTSRLSCSSALSSLFSGCSGFLHISVNLSVTNGQRETSQLLIGGLVDGSPTGARLRNENNSDPSTVSSDCYFGFGSGHAQGGETLRCESQQPRGRDVDL